MKAFIIIYYGQDPKPPAIFADSDMQTFLEEVVYLTKKKALFTVYKLGECVGDFS
jgi:hypothetical protein